MIMRTLLGTHGHSEWVAAVSVQVPLSPVPLAQGTGPLVWDHSWAIRDQWVDTQKLNQNQSLPST